MTFMKGLFKKLIKYTALLSAGAALTFGIMAGCSSEPAKRPSDPNDMGVVVEPPKVGSPMDYTAIENIEFIKGKLASREYYHLESESNVTATAGVKQKVEGTKDFLDGILVTETISYGAKAFGFIETPSKAIQRYFGEDEVYVRAPASDNKDEWNLDMEWSSAAPEILNDADYESAYGLRASELSDFVISEETIVSSGDLQKEGDKYSLTLTLDNEKAPAYYVNQMKTMGNLDEYPVFELIEITISFGEDWTVYSMQTHEVYQSKKFITASCEGGSVIAYSYDKADVDVSAYEEYFRQYEKTSA